ncbi:MAG: tetratricopeptide repeat protein, partial [Coleofasciculus sp. C2-GNP5-27]
MLSKLGRNEEAVASFEQAISLQPDSHQAWYNLSVVLSDLERNEEALVICEQAISIQPDFYQAWVQRGIAARNSLGSETFWQQNFVACFRSKCNKFANVLIPTLQNTNRERHLALFQASLHSSIALLKETFADSPKVIAQLEQPPSPKLSQIIQQPPSQTLIDFIQ